MNKAVPFLVLSTALLAVACGQNREPTPVSGVNLDALDRSTRPQDDFYQFANGGWLDSTEIPEMYSGYTVYHQVREEVEVALRTIINDTADNPGEQGSESQQVGDIYSSWMDVETINSLGVEPVLGEFAAVAAVESVEALTSVMARFLRMGASVPYRIQIYPGLEDSSQYTVYVNQSGITMPNRDYYLEPDNENFAAAREGLTPYIAKILVRTGMDEAEAQVAAENIYESAA